MSLYEKIKTISETVAGYNVIVDTSNGANVEFDRLAMPSILILIQQNGRYNTINSHYRDNANIRILLFNKITQDYKNSDIDSVKETLKSDMVSLYHKIKYNFDFKINANDLSYEILYDEFDSNLLGVVFNDTITERVGLNLACDETNTGTPSGNISFCEKVANCATIIQMQQDIEDLQQGSAGLNCETLPNCQTIIDLQNADVTLQANINTEATARGLADTLLQSNINAEITNRTNSDLALQSQIDDLDTGLNSHIADTTNPHNTTLEQARSENNTISGNINANSNQIDNLTNAVNPQQAATKNQLDAGVQEAKDYSDYLVQSNIKIIGDWDASSGSYPLADESNTTPFIAQWGATIKAGWAFRVGYGQNGTVDGYDYENGDVVYALIDSPADDSSDWGDLDHNLQQSTESIRGTSKIVTQAVIEDENTLDDQASVTAKKFWQGFAKGLTIASFFNAVRGTLLTGLSFSSYAIISSADSVLSAFGKLSARLEQWRNYGWSAGAVSGFTFTNNGNGTANIDSGIALLRTSASMTAQLNEYTLAAVTNQAFTDGVVNYVVADYNSGTPIINVVTNQSLINTLTVTLMYVVVRDGNNLYYNNVIGQNIDANGRIRRRFLLTEKFQYSSGALIYATNRKPSIGSGVFFAGLTPLTTPAFDCNASDTFTYVYYNGTNFTRTTGQTDIDNTNYIDTGVSTVMTNNRFRADFVYLLIDNPTQFWIVKGDAQYHSLSEAQTAPLPSNLPPELSGLGQLVGRYIIEKSATSLNIATSFITAFVSTSAVSHNQLPNLQGGTTNEFYHLTSSEYTGTGTGNFVRETSPTLSNPIVGTQTAGDNSTKAASTAFVQTEVSAISVRRIHNYQNTDSTHTGSTNEVVLANLQVTGGVMGANGVLSVDAFLIKSGTAGACTWKAYVSTVGTNAVGNTGVPSSSTQIGASTQAATNITGGRFVRRMANKNSAATQYVWAANASAVSDTAVTSNARTAVNINTANNFWVVLTATLANSADTSILSDIQLNIDKP